MKNYNFKVNLLKYGLMIYSSEDFNEEYFLSLEEKRYFYKKRIEKAIQDIFSNKVKVTSIVLKDDLIVINFDSGDKMEVTKISPTELEFNLNSGSGIHRFRFSDL